MSLAMSCLDVMYHQSYGAAHHYLPATPAAAAAAYRAAYQQQQQKKLSAYSKMQESMNISAHCAQGRQVQKPEIHREEVPGADGTGLQGKETQPAEAEYLSSRCVVFTYFQGNIGDVVDEHFSRALSRPSAFTGDAKPSKLSTGPLWKEGGPLSDSHCGSSLPPTLWSSSYPSQTAPCLSTVHPDFSAGAAFHPTDPAGIWSGHGLPQLSLAPAASLSDSWPYGLNPQGGASYHPHVHDLYSHHVHPRHAHPHNHTHPHMLPHSPSLEPCFSPLLLHPARPSCSPVSHTDAAKTDLEAGSTQPSSWQTFHSSVDIFETALEQDKVKAAVWF
ncbi:transcription cofactor vestigial-like protein 3 isoform X1 [Clupea harengus]|uniref:Transcription cofactor vestigial-like protein 3 isoform X1 n=2 Tax=Clupea harengus TaxID=7950 RepID=A0A6P8F1A9_CLUHA|nr:transcription cofactor vestigial-like protein 3 isoform X1 [Clupea harengus]